MSSQELEEGGDWSQDEVVTWSGYLGSKQSTVFGRLTSSKLPNYLNITCASTIASVYLGKVNVISHHIYNFNLNSLG